MTEQTLNRADRRTAERQATRAAKEVQRQMADRGHTGAPSISPKRAMRRLVRDAARLEQPLAQPAGTTRSRARTEAFFRAVACRVGLVTDATDGQVIRWAFLHEHQVVYVDHAHDRDGLVELRDQLTRIIDGNDVIGHLVIVDDRVRQQVQDGDGTVLRSEPDDQAREVL